MCLYYNSNILHLNSPGTAVNPFLSFHEMALVYVYESMLALAAMTVPVVGYITY